MTDYQDKYIKMLANIDELERKQEEAMLLSKSKEEEKKALEEKRSSLTKELENLKNKKENMLIIDDYISKLTTVSALTMIIIIIFHYKTHGIATSVLDKVIYYIFIFTSAIALFNFELDIAKKIINKKLATIKNSPEYKNVLERIETNEIELENISQKQKIVAEEYLNATLNYSALSASLKIKKEQLERFKDEVFGIIVGNLAETPEKPLTRVRTRENLNKRN